MDSTSSRLLSLIESLNDNILQYQRGKRYVAGMLGRQVPSELRRRILEVPYIVLTVRTAKGPTG
jgi:hypothetical protein